MDRVIEMEVVGYQIRRGSETLGAVGTGNAVALRFSFDAMWDGLAKSAKFTDARGDGGVTTEIELLTKNTDGSYTVPVPREAMAYEGMAELTLIGELAENGLVTKRLTTKPLCLRVYASGADREARNTEPITATDKQQILAKVDAAEGYAKGTVDGLPVPDRTEDNAKYYKEQAAISANAAEAAKGLAETYKNDACADRIAAEGYAKGTFAGMVLSEYAEDNAKYYKEQAHSSASDALKEKEAAESAAKTATEMADVAIRGIHNAFPTETQSGADIIHTDIGADGVPVKSLAVTVTSGAVPVTLTVRRLGKNIFNRQSITMVYKKWFNLNTGELESRSIACCSEQYFAVLPSTTYTFSGVAQANTGYSSRVYFYDADKNYITHKGSPYDASLIFTTPENCSWVRFSLPQYVHSKYTGEAATDPAEGTVGTIRSMFKPQLEFGSETPYEAYTEENHSITVTALNTPSELKNVTTMPGANAFEVDRIDGVSATISATYRVDPTLAFGKLKAAIVAAN